MQKILVQSLGGEIPWRWKGQNTPVSWPGKSHGQRSLVGCSPQGCKESGATEQLTSQLSSEKSSSLFWVNWLFDHCMESKGLDNTEKALGLARGKWDSSKPTRPPAIAWYTFSSVQFGHSVVSDSLRPREPQHARPPYPSPTPGFYPNSCPLSWWCHLTISSSVVPFSSHLRSFPSLGSFQMIYLSHPRTRGIHSEGFLQGSEETWETEVSYHQCIFMEPWDVVLGTIAGMLPVTKRIAWMKIFHPPATWKMTSSMPKINTQPRIETRWWVLPGSLWVHFSPSFQFLLKWMRCVPSWKFLCTARSCVGMGSASLDGQIERSRSSDSAGGLETEL